uniref:Uncharacterized protein n=1 Tax=Arundo donax TaxID=35708 RepID=A0A0A9G653_ARUDO
MGSPTRFGEIFDNNNKALSASAVQSDTHHPLSAVESVHDPFALWR